MELDPFVRLRDQRIEAVITSNSQKMFGDARAAHCDVRTLERQVRLHLPSPLCELDSSPAEAYDSIRAIAITRAARISAARRSANANADNYNLSQEMSVTRNGLRAPDGALLPIEVRNVPPSIGHIYQADIHYLLAPRADTLLHFGTFEPGATHPLLYIAISSCDREYQVSAFDKAYTGRKTKPLVITRVVGVTDLPKNTISFTVARVADQIQKLGYGGDLITAVNPLIGFTAASMLASSFEPIAVAPVTYAYELDGNFVTNQLATSEAAQANEWPANLLLGRPIDLRAKHAVKLTMEMINKLPAVTKSNPWRSRATKWVRKHAD